MAELSNYVSLTITQDSVGVARAGFGVPLMLSAYAAFPERVREYTDLADVSADGFATTGPEYLSAQAFFSQQPRPEKVLIGRADNKPIQKYLVEVAAVRNSYAYQLNAKGEGVTTTAVSYTSDSGATQQEISNGLLTALNAVVGRNFLATFPALVVADFTFTGEADDDTLTATAHGLQTGDGPVQVSNSGGALPGGLSAATDYWAIRTGANTFQLAISLANALAGTAIALSTDGTGTQTLSDTASTVSPYLGIQVTGTAVTEWFSIEVVNVNDLAIAQTHVDPGVAADLDAIKLQNNTWYALHTFYNSNAYVLAAAAWVEANKKIYVVDVNETDSITQADGASDTLDDLQTLSYARTMGAYHPDPSAMFSAAWMGRCLPLEPGSETWSIKRLAGVAAVSLSATHRANLVARNANSYETVAAIDVTFNGTTADGDFMDVQRGLDWLEDDIAKSVFEALAGANKIPFEDDGVAVIEGEIRGSLRRAVTRKILAASPAPNVTVPLVADVSSSDKALRRLPDVKFSGTLSGAIHKVIINGVVSV